MTLINWHRAYAIEKEMEIEKLFDSNGGPMFIDPKIFNNYVVQIPILMQNEICVL